MSENLWNALNRRQTIRKEANKVADRLVKTYTDEELQEFVCWFFDRLGNKYDKDVVKFAETINSAVSSSFEKVTPEQYEKLDKGFDDREIEFLKSIPGFETIGLDPLELLTAILDTDD